MIYDVLGIGFGPANISLAITLREEYPEIKAHFLEKNAEPQWQNEMLLEDANIQNSPFNDLVTLRNPTSKYSFLSYLHSKQRLLRFFDLDLEYPLRLEYDDYIKWAADDFKDICGFESHVNTVEVINVNNKALFSITTGNGEQLLGKSLVVATGRTPYIPREFVGLPSGKCFHLTSYLSSIEQCLRVNEDNIAVIGSGQSAVEIILDLLKRTENIKVKSFLRHFAFRLKDTNPFMEQGILPEHTKSFYKMSWQGKEQWRDDLKYINYGSADMDVLQELNLHQYKCDILQQESNFELVNNSVIVKAEKLENNKIHIHSVDKYTKKNRHDFFDAVVLATGFKNIGPGDQDESFPSVIKNIQNQYKVNDLGFCDINLDYSLSPKHKTKVPPVYLNGLCEVTHGMGDAGTFSLLSLRAKNIANSLCKQLNA